MLIDEKAQKTRPLVILDARPEEQFNKGHIIGGLLYFVHIWIVIKVIHTSQKNFSAQHYPRILLCREHYETESLKRVGIMGIVIVCGQTCGAAQVVSTFCDRGHNAVLLRGGTLSKLFLPR